MKRQDVLAIWNVLESLGNEQTSVEFAYVVAKNQALIKDEYESVKKSILPSKSYQKYEEARLEIAKINASKNSTGQPNMANGNIIIDPNNVEKIKGELEKLNKENEEAIKERELQMKEAEDFFEQEINIEFETTLISNFPKTLTPNQMKYLIQFIKET
ncbi:MAG: hypothetical protein KAS32_05845 [Candidatus Peribacteraceae bacterium]|nr:hypothetical protein [Candidatus Peribacteraceae bacterium]